MTRSRPVNAQFGPFYRTDQVATLLGVTRQAVADRVRQRSLLGMRTTDGTWVYPTFQFDGRICSRACPPCCARSIAATMAGPSRPG